MALYTYRNSSLDPVTKTTFAEQAILEVRHLQPAIADRIDAVAPGAMVIDCEHKGWEGTARSIDILALDRMGRLVVIELKRTEDGGALDLQALRYAAMVSTYSFERVVEVFDGYMAKRGRPLQNARQTILDHLDPELAMEESITGQVRIVLVSAGFSKEITSTVIWLNSQGLDICCVRLQLYMNGTEVLLDSDQLIPVPETAEYMLAQRRKHLEITERAGRDYTKFDFITPTQTFKRLNKRRLMYQVVKAAIREGVSVQELQVAIPGKRTYMFRQLPGGISAASGIALFGSKDVGRYFSVAGEEIVEGQTTYLLTNQWGNQTEEAANAVIALMPQPASFVVEPSGDLLL